MTPPLSLYVHIPWCVKKCPYCDFNSHEASGGLPEQAYVAALLDDLDRDMEQFNIASGKPLESIFIGGGTPSLFSGSSMSELMNGIRARLSLDPNAEVTLETNPGAADAENFVGYKQAGINRISLGVQSFGQHQLEALGRIHTANEATVAFQKARDAGFEHINIDLMHGLPNQNTAAALTDLSSAIALSPEHISWYQLTIEPNTVFYSKPPDLPEDDTLWEIYEHGTKLLGEAGYSRYEVSAYARDGYRSAHNLNYWTFGDYLGIGAGAHGKLSNSTPTQLSITRTNKTRLPNDFLKLQKTNQQAVPQNDLLLEFLMNGLRLVHGFDVALFTKRTGLDEKVLLEFASRAVSKKLVEFNDGLLRPTDLGLQYLNDLLLLTEVTD